jgi:hypothetical protein
VLSCLAMEYPPKRKKQVHERSPTGSTTNASDAVDDMKLPPNPTVDEKLDEGVKETFPASDPVSIANNRSETAYEREKRLRKKASSG